MLPHERSTAHRILWISELQDRIFAFNGAADATRCARVCKAWKEKALDHVWYTLPGLEPLLRLFAVLVSYRTKTVTDFRLIRTLRPSDWVRAAPFLRRINYMWIDLSRCKSFPSESLIGLLTSRPETRMLPNLISLWLAVGPRVEWLRYMVPFLHDRLIQLVIRIEIDSSESTRSDAEAFLEEIGCRATKLRRAEICIYAKAAGKMDDALSKFFSSQNSLESVRMAPGLLTTPVFTSLSFLPNLCEIDFTSTRPKRLNLRACRNVAITQRNEESFPNLRFLDLHTRAASVTSLISSHSNFTRLKRLCIDTIFQNDAEEIQKCMEAISTTSRYLETLCFTRNVDDGNKAEIVNEETNPITKDIIAPLASFRFLRRFILVHTQPIIITDNDLVGLLGRCAKFSELCLNPSAIQMSDSPAELPSIGVLHRIAQCQPKLKSLGLYLSAAKERDPDLPFNTNALTVPFQLLEMLDLGYSTTDDVDWTTGYLSQILPPKCKLEYTDTSDTSSDIWAEVWERLPTLTRIISGQRECAARVSK